ncbi:kinase-like domain-containing protein [Paraphoma chrysanthemicola]|nr:kinase-like domain-containing protein [Paraphoma chrysanthemicola]
MESSTPGTITVGVTYVSSRRWPSFHNQSSTTSSSSSTAGIVIQNGCIYRWSTASTSTSNILIKSRPPDGWCVKLCDLGLSRRTVDASGTTTILGTRPFMAPETRGSPFDGNPWEANDFRADMWSVGETLARAMTGQATFDTDALLEFQEGRRGFPFQRLKSFGLSSAAIDFVHALMQIKPNQRLAAKDALQHRWLQPRWVTKARVGRPNVVNRDARRRQVVPASDGSPKELDSLKYTGSLAERRRQGLAGILHIQVLWHAVTTLIQHCLKVVGSTAKWLVPAIVSWIWSISEIILIVVAYLVLVFGYLLVIAVYGFVFLLFIAFSFMLFAIAADAIFVQAEIVFRNWQNRLF